MSSTKQRFHFGCDIDSTANNWEGQGSPLFKIWKKKFPNLEFLGSKRSSEYEISQNYPEEYREKIIDIYKHPQLGFFRNMPPMMGVQKALSELSKFGTITMVSTAISASFFDLRDTKERRRYNHFLLQCIREKVEWVEEHIAPALEHMPEMVFVTDKSTFSGHVLIDDNPHVVTNCKYKPTWTHVLYDEGYLWNKNTENKFRVKWTDPDCTETILKIAQCNQFMK